MKDVGEDDLATIVTTPMVRVSQTLGALLYSRILLNAHLENRQKNVCYHFIMGNCKYNDGSCWYSHDLSHLMPSKKKVAALAGRRKVIGKETDKEELFKKMTELKESGQFGKDLPFRKRRRGGNGEVMLDLDEDDDDLDGGMFGFSAADVELLLEQGIKPWDDDAEAALAVLSYY
ncbi:hypothetical protein VNI00_009484 [Paramarasmius palmivorus]|uniref:C3H1-type domain-containing protein n=1 Tax=Paramarasmius palmivorus TaxID=297713 RepID=A0AAW0CRH6_9AGAR